MSDLIGRLHGYDWRGKERSRTAHEAADQLEAQQAEIARLRDIVVSAYHEGFCDALDEAPCCNVTSLEVLWPKSLSCAALEQKP